MNKKCRLYKNKEVAEVDILQDYYRRCEISMRFGFTKFPAFQISDFRLQIRFHRFQVPDFRFQISISDSRFQISNSGYLIIGLLFIVNLTLRVNPK